MKSIDIEVKDIEKIYLFGVKELEQMLVQEEEQRKLLQVKKNSLK